MLIKKILCPIDLSADTRTEIAYAVSFAQANKAELGFLYVMCFSARGPASSAEPDPFFYGLLGLRFSVNDLCKKTISRIENLVLANFGREVTGELFAYDSVGTSVRAFQQGAPIKILAVNLQSPLFWLVTRPELKSLSELKGKVMGTTSFGGVQHLAGLRMLRRGGLNPEEEITVILAGDPATQLQAIVNGAIHIAVLSPRTVILARDKFKLNVLANALDEFPSFFQSGLAVSDKSLSSQRELVKRILRARAKANRFFFETDNGASEVIAKVLKVDLPVARESYRISRNAFSMSGIVSQRQIEEFLKMDAEIAKIPDPLRATAAFDFSLQHEVNNELGIK